MKFRIKETQEIKELEVIDRETGVEWTADLMDAADFYNHETEEHEIDLEGYKWWAEYIEHHENDEEEAKTLAEELEIDPYEIEKEINYWIDPEMSNHHDQKQQAFKEIRERYQK